MTTTMNSEGAGQSDRPYHAADVFPLMEETQLARIHSLRLSTTVKGRCIWRSNRALARPRRAIPGDGSSLALDGAECRIVAFRDIGVSANAWLRTRQFNTTRIASMAAGMIPSGAHQQVRRSRG